MKLFIFSATFSAVYSTLKYLEIKKYKSLCYNLEKPEKCQYNIMFINDDNKQCRPHIYRKISCSENCSYKILKKILNLIRGAKHSIKLCIYHTTIEDIAMEIIKAKKRGIQIQILADYGMQTMSGSKVHLFIGADISVKCFGTQQSYLHHKFCLIDYGEENELLIIGSGNFTLQAMVKNWDFFLFTDHKFYVDRFNTELEILYNIA